MPQLEVIIFILSLVGKYDIPNYILDLDNTCITSCNILANKEGGISYIGKISLCDNTLGAPA